MQEKPIPRIIATTVIGVRRNGQAAMGSDGQVTIGETIMKHTTKKVRRIFNDQVVVGFAGASADAMALFDKFENELEKYKGNVNRAAVELAKIWRTDKYLRQLEALLTVMNKETMLIISGTGDVIEPDDDIIAIGSGGAFATAAARALLRHTEMNAREIVAESLRIASEICIYTNNNFTIIEL
ncbi:MAG TPA: ATP-dependent protease subunit HslV [Candidatus Marinimicrobia bacterium]|jgi:ATP-dependent HslUV protease subunit HslV|nr:ATP-dependent protease subunit HslV [Candidatus Neomarinimicrobiota bacterium]HOU17446.1 ATP-dependent protease subunit HslV [Candidatus Neomarinimicrobiota bacterium]HOV24126.1 ATP-dependent protease subunit HslV [Candidatus Neomarinimicrobiota bacterium]HPA99780.1 ATP-dependent protease subunit HslV [Candidatus Neomarinimicrobiota bacterium]HPI27497.1 ATP-dependent protease subunit HslV [Candidatus Neomarinimicrobiota bacterium]